MKLAPQGFTLQSLPSFVFSPQQLTLEEIVSAGAHEAAPRRVLTEHGEGCISTLPCVQLP